MYLHDTVRRFYAAKDAAGMAAYIAASDGVFPNTEGRNELFLEGLIEDEYATTQAPAVALNDATITWLLTNCCRPCDIIPLLYTGHDTPVYHAVLQGSYNWTRLLLMHGAKPSTDMLLMFRAVDGPPHSDVLLIVWMLLEHGADSMLAPATVTYVHALQAQRTRARSAALAVLCSRTLPGGRNVRELVARAVWRSRNDAGWAEIKA